MTYGQIIPEFQLKLKEIVGQDNYHVDEETLKIHASD
ncbi:MAG: hypothetical protein ACI9EQ_001652, partial [Bacteroidia bacterium]